MDYYKISNLGSREINEDAADIIVKGDNALFVLADGLGGHGRGEVASALVVETAKELFEKSESTEKIIERIFEESQKRLLNKQQEEHAQDEMKTTAVILLITKDMIQWGHIGDSRLYFFKKNKLIKRTLDHSVPQVLVSSGELRESKIRNHPDRNRLLRVLGMEWRTSSYAISEPVKREGTEAFLLCSDGFWENIVERDMQKMLKKNDSAKAWLDAMEVIVQKNGKGRDMDNNTAITVILNNNL